MKSKLDSVQQDMRGVAWVVFGLCVITIPWDIYQLDVTPNLYYWISKIVTIFIPIGVTYVKWDWIREYRYACLFTAYYVYCFNGLMNFHGSYYFAFWEFFFGMPFFYPYNAKLNKPVHLFGALACFIGIHFSTELPYVKEGASAKPDLFMSTFLVVVATWALTNIAGKIRYKNSLIRDQLAILGKSSGFLMHEMKSPLSKIGKLGDGSGVSQDFLREVDRLSAVLTTVEILTFKKENQLKKSPLRYSEILEHTDFSLAQLKQALNFKQTVTGFSGEFVNAHQVMIELLFKNLVKNALEATADLPEELRWIEITKQGEKLVFTNPLDPKHKYDHSRCLEAGYSSKQNVGNQGLGLALCHEICQLHGWKLELIKQSNRFQIEIRLS